MIYNIKNVLLMNWVLKNNAQFTFRSGDDFEIESTKYNYHIICEHHVASEQTIFGKLYKYKNKHACYNRVHRIYGSGYNNKALLKSIFKADIEHDLED